MFMFCSMIECMNNEQSLLIYFPPELLRKNLFTKPTEALFIKSSKWKKYTETIVNECSTQYLNLERSKVYRYTDDRHGNF